MADNDRTTEQYLTFALDEDTFALPIASVREVLELGSMVSIPKSPGFMRGVLNLRGHAVPVVAVRRKFGLPPIPDTVETCVIIVEIVFGESTAIMGALVDSVPEVVDLKESDVEDAPNIGTAVKADFIHGMSKVNGKFVTILDIDHIFSAEELAAFMPDDTEDAAPGIEAEEPEENSEDSGEGTEETEAASDEIPSAEDPAPAEDTETSGAQIIL